MPFPIPDADDTKGATIVKNFRTWFSSGLRRITPSKLVGEILSALGFQPAAIALVASRKELIHVFRYGNAEVWR